jgi:hypothetical protein
VRVEETDATTLTKSFVYNEQFSVERGKEFFINGEIVFPGEAPLRDGWSGARADGSYRTIFGPSIAHDGVIFGVSNHNQQLAMRRLLRCVGSKEDHTAMRARQLVFMEGNMDVIDQLRAMYSSAMSDYSNASQEAEEHHDDPHQKKALRIEAWKTLIENGEVSSRTWMRHPAIKLKKNEWAKPGKEGRGIANLGVEASLLGFRVTGMLKQAMADNSFDYMGGTIHFCAHPSYDELRYVFDMLLNPPGRFFFVYFSDDACIAIRTKDGRIIRGDVDISSCDASHGPALFKAYPLLAEGEARVDLQRLVEQCTTAFRVYDVSTQSNYVQLKPHGPRLYSGSTITTTINGLANIFIAVAIAQAEVNTPQDLVKAARRAGYVVTLKVAEQFEDVTFLKHSPVLDKDGVWQPLLNIGVLLRMTGVCNGDLPGRGDLQTRAVAFQRALLRGAYPRASFPLIDNMKRVVAGSNTTLDQLMTSHVDKLLEYKISEVSSRTLRFNSEDVYRRYKLEPWQAYELDECFGNSGFGTCYGGPAAAAILEMDYGLTCKYF